jgi:hypothetical protein
MGKDRRHSNSSRSQSLDVRLGLARPGPTARQRMDAMEFFRCQGCGEVIGVYEPLVAYDGNSGYTTSRAAEPDLRANAAAYYHGDCYAAVEEPVRLTASGR